MKLSSDSAARARRSRAVNARDRDGKSALHHAARTGNPQAVRALVEKGADVGGRDHNIFGWGCAARS